MKIDDAKIKEPPASLRRKGSQENTRRGLYSDELTGEYYKFSLEKLIPFKNQARVGFDQGSISSLAETIKEHGIRQPLTVVPSPVNEGKYEIVSGERRYRAAKLAGIERVPCLIINNYKKAEEISLIENTQREDLHPIELGHAFNSLIERGVCNSSSEIASKLSLSKSKVVECIGFTRLPELVKNNLIKGKVSSRRLLRELHTCSSTESMLERISSESKDKEHSKTNSKAMTRSINSLFALTRKNNDLIFKANVFNKLDTRRKLEIIDEIGNILESLKERH